MHDQKKNNKPFSENVAVISCICMTKRIPSHKMNKNACLMTPEAKKIELRWFRKTMSDCLQSVCYGKQNTGLQGFSHFKMRIRDDISLTERKAVDLK